MQCKAGNSLHLYVPRAGPLWLQWIKSTRKVPLRISEGDCKRVEAHTITEHATLRSPTPAVSDAIRSHISETPVKSEGNHNEVECTSRPGVILGTSSHTLLLLNFKRVVQRVDCLPRRRWLCAAYQSSFMHCKIISGESIQGWRTEEKSPHTHSDPKQEICQAAEEARG